MRCLGLHSNCCDAEGARAGHLDVLLDREELVVHEEAQLAWEPAERGLHRVLALVPHHQDGFARPKGRAHLEAAEP
eukprot:scaffold20093_cov63-Phaeocystis_antarctica.AAC.5